MKCIHSRYVFRWLPALLIMLGCSAQPPIELTDITAQPGYVSGSLVYALEDRLTPQCHATTIAETPGGLVAAWFGGTREKNPDVGIWLSRHTSGGWSRPTEVVNGVISAEERYPCWNPVLFQQPDGPLILYYKVGPSPREWWGMVMESTNNGQSWAEPERLPEGILGPIKNKPISLPNGDILCPTSTEHDGWRDHFEIYHVADGTWTTTDPVEDTAEYGAIQPTVLEHPGGKLQALSRSKKGDIVECWSADNGRSWSSLEKTMLPNPNSGIDGVTLQDGRHLLVYNHTTTLPGEWGGPRSPLNVALSLDGKQWTMALILEDDDGEYSYPAVIQAADGMVHISYTWRRESVKHVVIDPAKLTMQTGQAAVPGVIINYSPAESQQYIGSPSIAILPDGSYLASHDYFGKGSTYNQTLIFHSTDTGRHWSRISKIDGQFWSSLFQHREALYIIGTSSEYGHAIIRRSDDGGKTWTVPQDAGTGLLSADDRYHCAPVPILEHNGRLWRGFELAVGKRPEWKTVVLSAPVDADLLQADSWTISEPFAHPWHDSQWIEGNVVLRSDGQLVDILRTDDAGTAAMLNISSDGRTLSCTPEQERINLPGGTKKFTIRYDEVSKLYWSMTNVIKDPALLESIRASRIRNTQALISSADLKTWNIRAISLQHDDAAHHGFQYVDWVFEGDDIIFVSRTAFDDDLTGAHNAHDANYLTFHRIQDFRNQAYDNPWNH
jgi:predicted neuraminidase